MAVDLKGGPRLLGGGQHRLHIEVEAGTPADLAPAQVGDRRTAGLRIAVTMRRVCSSQLSSK